MSKARLGLLGAIIFLILFIIITIFTIKNPAEKFRQIYLKSNKAQILDRNNRALNITFANEWNLHNFIKLEDIPTFLQQSFLLAEDKRFYQHHGVDWLAKLNAIRTNIIGYNVRGASTISEQVVKMINPRRRNLWSKWLEAIEAILLEKEISKSEIFEFYLNQVPYSKRNRGIVEGANYYFGRDISLLNKKSMMALAIIIRSPNRFDLHKKPLSIKKSLERLLTKLSEKNIINNKELEDIKKQELQLDIVTKQYDYSHFSRYVLENFVQKNDVTITTTLDLDLQNQVHEIANRHLDKLQKYHVNNGAIVILDSKNNEVLSWVVANSKNSNNQDYDSVITKRQAGSTLKPFLYALNIDLGANANMIIDDSKMLKAIGSGVHQINNYSHTNYGKITLRQALANSLNIPAIKTIDKIGVENFLKILHKLKFDSLNQSSEFYGSGLALGNGEITLFELVRAFSVFSNNGLLVEPKFILNSDNNSQDTRIFKASTTSIIGDILSDKVARSLEFSGDIEFPSQTAFKTGTSTDFRDAWIVAYNSNYVIGIWLGNLDNKEMDGVTGSIGALPILQEILNFLETKTDLAPLYYDKSLIKKDVCLKGRLNNADQCNSYTEIFAHDEISKKNQLKNHDFEPKILFPTDNLIIAIDPKSPRQSQILEVEISNLNETDIVKLFIDNKLVKNNSRSWPISKGNHEVLAIITRDNIDYQTNKILFSVIGN